MTLHLLKLAVGVESAAHLARIQKERRAERRARGEGTATWHFTRNFPRRAEDVLDGGSLYWIIRGEIVVRQRILGFEQRVRPGGRKRCAIRLAANVVRTVPLAHRAIQGWRYLLPSDAPPDLADATPKSRGEEKLPPEMARELQDLGLL